MAQSDTIAIVFDEAELKSIQDAIDVIPAAHGVYDDLSTRFLGATASAKPAAAKL